MTLRDAIAQVRSVHKLVSSDAKLNDRTIARELKNAALMLVKQNTDKRRLWSSPNLFTPLPCLELVERSLGECCNYTSPYTIARSKEKIPRIAEGIWGPMIQYCTGITIVRGKELKESNPVRFSNLLKLGLKNKEIFFWIHNDYLWVTSPEMEAVEFSAYFEDDVPTSLLYPGEDCSCKPKPTNADLCKNPLDQPYRLPGYLVSTAIDMVSKRLLQSYFNLVQDKSADGNDQQSK